MIDLFHNIIHIYVYKFYCFYLILKSYKKALLYIKTHFYILKYSHHFNMKQTIQLLQILLQNFLLLKYFKLVFLSYHFYFLDK